MTPGSATITLDDEADLKKGDLVEYLGEVSEVTNDLIFSGGVWQAILKKAGAVTPAEPSA